MKLTQLMNQARGNTFTVGEMPRLQIFSHFDTVAEIFKKLWSTQISIYDL